MRVLPVLAATFVLAVAGPAAARQHGDHASASGATGPATVSLDTTVNGRYAELLITRDEAGSQVLLHQRSDDGGATWSAPIAIEPSRGRLSGASRGVDPQIAGAGDRLVAVWMAKGQSSRGNGHMEGARSDDGGRTWAAIGRLDDHPTAVSQAFIDIGADREGRFHAVWLDSRDGGQGLRTVASRDGGKTWTAGGTIDARTCECCWNTVAEAGDGSLVVLYRDKDPRDMALARSTDSGRTWQRTGAVGAFDWGFNGCPHVGGALAVGRTASDLHALVWTGHDEKLGVWALASTDAGRSWGAPARVGPADAWHVDLVRLGDRLIAAYDVNRPGDFHIAWAESTDAGRTWREKGRVSAATARASHPKLVTGAGRVTVAWTEREAGGPLQWKHAVLVGTAPTTERRR